MISCTRETLQFDRDLKGIRGVILSLVRTSLLSFMLHGGEVKIFLVGPGGCLDLGRTELVL